MWTCRVNDPLRSPGHTAYHLITTGLHALLLRGAEQFVCASPQAVLANVSAGST